MLKLQLIAGARPNFMKIAPIIRELDRRAETFEYQLVHTGQHYDESMSKVFFDDLGIPSPHVYLDVGSGTHAEQTAKVMVNYEPVCADYRADCVIVVGDVNSTTACSLVSKKLGIKVAHVEAGLRSGDRAMPEEINRIVTDAISDYFFVTEQSGVTNLRREGHELESIFFVGHVMIDNLFYELERLTRAENIDQNLAQLKSQHGSYGVITMHRPSNVDDEATLRRIFGALNEVSERLPFFFPMHPRTRARVEAFGLSLSERIHVLQPLGYKDFLTLWKDAVVVLTDSGGLQEETTGLQIPCITIRENTERPITVEQGTNQLVGTDPERLKEAVFSLLGESDTKYKIPELWDGQASIRIADHLERELMKR